MTRVVQVMTNRIRPYAWGSRTAIAELQGRPTPSAHPEAELWIGAHPGDPSAVEDRPLGAVIGDDPRGQLGAAVAGRFDGTLPFLLKVLAAAEPLSLQAHPTTEQARRGYDAEQAEGIPLGSPHRNYKDRSHKPELISALTEFHALCGFRDPHRTVELVDDLGCEELDRYAALLRGQPDEHGTRALFSSVITMPGHVLMPVLDAVLARCVERLRSGTPFEAEYRTALELGERYQGDPGVLASLMLNRVTLQPGEALYLGAGNLHAYLSGTGVEIMANSDNVLRGGLTPKHVDVPELMRVLDFHAAPVDVLVPEPVAPGVGRYGTPVEEFALCVVEPAQAPGGVVELDHDGPRVALVVHGEVELTTAGGGEPLRLQRGQSGWLPACDGPVRFRGDARVHVASDGLVTTTA